MLKKTAQKGFTIVELLIVIVVIGILAALVLNTFTGVQQRARDTDRQNDVTQTATQLEVYFNDNGHYPKPSQLADDTWIRANLKGLDVAALRAPDQATNSVSQATASNSKDNYGYEGLNAAGTACGNAAADTGADCVKFKLTFTKEQLKAGETNPIAKDSLNQ